MITEEPVINKSIQTDRSLEVILYFWLSEDIRLSIFMPRMITKYTPSQIG